MTFTEQLARRAQTVDSLVSVGLDSDLSRLPRGYDQLAFNKAIVDATHDLVLAYKPNTAFYEAAGANGIAALKATCEYIREKAPGALILLDAKRGDIGNTNNGYVTFAYDYLGGDALTLHPYLGREALTPFLERTDKGAIILCRTSNPGSGEFQDIGNVKLFENVARSVSTTWNENDNCLLVVGATYPEEIAVVRKIVGDTMWLLVPGIGAQGGDLKATLGSGLTKRGDGLIINSSRDILFASSEADFAEVARRKTQELKDAINNLRRNDT